MANLLKLNGKLGSVNGHLITGPGVGPEPGPYDDYDLVWQYSYNNAIIDTGDAPITQVGTSNTNIQFNPPYPYESEEQSTKWIYDGVAREFISYPVNGDKFRKLDGSNYDVLDYTDIQYTDLLVLYCVTRTAANASNIILSNSYNNETYANQVPSTSVQKLELSGSDLWTSFGDVGTVNIKRSSGNLLLIGVSLYRLK